MLSKGRLVLTVSATTDAFLRHYSHVWRWWLCKQDDHSKQWLSKFLGHLPECWHPFLNFVPIKRKETTVTGRAAHSPRVKKSTTRFEPVGDACRGLDKNGRGHGRSKPADSYLHTRNPARGRANQRGDFAWDKAMLPKYQGTGAHPGVIPVRVLPRTRRATELSQYVPRCPDHQKEVGATRPYQTLAQSHSQTGRLKQTAPVPAPRCSSCPAGAFWEQPLLQTAAWGCGEPLPAPASGTGKLRSMWHWKVRVLHRAVLGKHGKLKHSCLLPPWKGSYSCP